MFDKTPGMVDVDDSSIAAAPRKLLLVDRRKAAMLGVPQQADRHHAARGTGRRGRGLPARRNQVPAAATLQLPAERQGDLDTLLQLAVRGAGQLVPIRELVPVSDSCASSRSTTRTCCR